MSNGVTTGLTHEVLMALVDRDGRKAISLDFAETSDLVPGSGRDVDDVLLDARHRGEIVGERREGDGSVSWWSKESLTVPGLQRLGE